MFFRLWRSHQRVIAFIWTLSCQRCPRCSCCHCWCDAFDGSVRQRQSFWKRVEGGKNQNFSSTGLSSCNNVGPIRKYWRKKEREKKNLWNSASCQPFCLKIPLLYYHLHFFPPYVLLRNRLSFLIVCCSSS